MRARTLVLLPALVPALALGACATPQPVKTAESTTRDGIGGAMSAPLADFNVVRVEIPAVLREAKEDPYDRPEPLTCTILGVELGRLDDALGPDIDAKKPVLSKGNQRAEIVAKAGVAAVKDVAEGWIPMRGWVRYMTGAQKHDDAVRAAVAAGQVRRAYLKGLAQSQSCVGIGPRPTKLFPAPPVTPSTVTNVANASKP